MHIWLCCFFFYLKIIRIHGEKRNQKFKSSKQTSTNWTSAINRMAALEMAIVSTSPCTRNTKYEKSLSMATSEWHVETARTNRTHKRNERRSRLAKRRKINEKRLYSNWKSKLNRMTTHKADLLGKYFDTAWFSIRTPSVCNDSNGYNHNNYVCTQVAYMLSCATHMQLSRGYFAFDFLSLSPHLLHLATCSIAMQVNALSNE